MNRCLAGFVFAAAVGLAAQVPFATRVFGPAGNLTLDALVADVAKTDVVFVSEQQSGAAATRVELAILEGLARLEKKVVLALGSLERDAQEPLEHLLMEHTTEAEFLAEARPGAAFPSHKPLLDFAIRRKWPVVAATVPGRIVDAVAAKGLGVLDALPASDRTLVAKEAKCPGSRSAAQCLEDETIAESIAQSHAAGSIGGTKPVVVAVVDAVYADFRGGAVAALVRRQPQLRVAVVRVLPVNVLPSVRPSAESGDRSDFAVFAQ
jgi:hypothetical protein